MYPIVYYITIYLYIYVCICIVYILCTKQKEKNHNRWATNSLIKSLAYTPSPTLLNKNKFQNVAPPYLHHSFFLLFG